MGENGHKRILFHAALPHHFVFFQSVYERLAEDARLDWFWSSNFLGWQLKKHLFDLFPVKGKKVASFAGNRSNRCFFSCQPRKFDDQNQSSRSSVTSCS